jgi:hypothetical protein
MAASPAALLRRLSRVFGLAEVIARPTVSFIVGAEVDFSKKLAFEGDELGGGVRGTVEGNVRDVVTAEMVVAGETVDGETVVTGKTVVFAETAVVVEAVMGGEAVGPAGGPLGKQELILVPFFIPSRKAQHFRASWIWSNASSLFSFE